MEPNPLLGMAVAVGGLVVAAVGPVLCLGLPWLGERIADATDNFLDWWSEQIGW